MTRHVVVIGGAGFIGSHLVEHLLGAGKHVVVIDDLSTGRRENLCAFAHHPALRVIASKVSETPDLDAVLAGAESVYHLAAAVGVDLVVRAPLRTMDTNLREAETIFAAAAAAGVPLLHVSTCEVYGNSRRDVFSESDDLLVGRPHLARWSYACSKLMTEFLAMGYGVEQGLPVVTVRLFNTVGPRQTGAYGMVLPRFVEAAMQGLPLRVFGDGMQTRCFSFVRDTVEALVRLQNTPGTRGEIYNVGGTEEISMMDLARLVIATVGSSSRIELVPYDEAYPAGFEDLRRGKPSVEKLLRATGFVPHTPLRRIIEHVAGISHETPATPMMLGLQGSVAHAVEIGALP